MGDTIELSALEYDVLWEHLRLGAFPTVLQINSHGATHAERAELTAKAWESLAERKLGWPSALDGRLRNRLRLLARLEWELDARLYLNPNEPRTSALIAANHSSAVVAVLRDNRLTLRTRQPTNSPMRPLPCSHHTRPVPAPPSPCPPKRLTPRQSKPAATPRPSPTPCGPKASADPRPARSPT